MNNTTASDGPTGSTKDELKHDADRLFDTAKQTAEHKAEQGRDSAVQAAHSTQSALDKAAQELRDEADAPDWLASALSNAGSKIGSLADELDGKPPTEMVDAVRRYGRQSLGLFMLAAGAAGFAAGRFLRAGAEENDDIPVDHDTGLSGHSTGGGSSGTRAGMQPGSGAGYSATPSDVSNYGSASGTTTGRGGASTSYATGGTGSVGGRAGDLP